MPTLEEREWRGEWWEPEAPTAKAPGILTFSQELAQLDLLGPLPGPTLPERLFEFEERPVFHGTAVDGTPITLDNCTPRTIDTLGEHHYVGRICIGEHFDEEIALGAIEIRFLHLDEWVGLSGISSSVTREGEQAPSVKIHFQRPDSVVAELADGASVEFGFAWGLYGRAFVTKRAELVQQASAIVHFAEPTGIDAALHAAHQLRNFLNLGVGAPVHPVEIHGHVNGEERKRVEIFYRLADQPDPRDLTRTVWPPQMRFTLADVQARLAEVLQTWFGRYETIRPTIDLYFSVIYGGIRFLQPRFLSLMQAMETYHRRTSTKTRQPPDEFTKWRKSVLGQISSKTDRARVAESLQYANELSLRMRLRDLLEDVGPLADKVIAGDQKQFIDHCVAGRNFLTHYSEEAEEGAPMGAELLPLIVRLAALVALHLLREIGFEPEEIDEIFDRTRVYEEIDHVDRITLEE